MERMLAQLQQCEGECLTIAEASQCVFELIDAIADTKSQVDANPGLDLGLRTEIHAWLDVLYRALKAQSLGATAIAKALGIGRASVYRVLEASN